MSWWPNPRQSVPLLVVMFGAALVIAMAVTGIVRSNYFHGARDEAAHERDVAALNAAQIAAAAEYLCAQQGPAAAQAHQLGLCETAREVRKSPTVAAITPRSDAEIRRIVREVIAHLPPGVDVATVTRVVREQLARARPQLSDERLAAAAAAAVADYFAAHPVPEPKQGPPGPQGVSFAGLIFERRDGQCVAVVTFLDPATGQTTERTQPVNDVVCPPPPPPPESPEASPSPRPSPSPSPSPSPEPSPDPPASSPSPSQQPDTPLLPG